MMIWIITISILVSLSSNSWFIFWLMMEINMMSFIPIMNDFKMKNYNSMITYFIIQSFSSSLFFISSFQYSLFNMELFFSLINISVLIKLGMIPFHFWLIMISESLTFYSLLILLTIQKIIPLLIIEKFMNSLMIPLFIMSSLLASIMAMKYKLIKQILIFSSISHQGWILCLIAKKMNFWVSYLMLYSIIIYSIIINCKEMNFNKLCDLTKKKISSKMKNTMIMSMMSLAGMPPFIGFFMKIMAIFFLMKMNLIFMMILIISSLINLFFYLRILTPLFFINSKFSIWSFNNMKSNFMIKINMLLLIILINIFF
uniref:NADH-ubiquinone oxidoreductase chain 2 n=1 Tax=Rhipicephalus sanguineus TaxID=34632 RepID=NU2M_RHISA|nr:NADH dehydrogenase subunit 2 [Rhipicephalus sanguineus]O99817.1 RecName: Full=NADH-ubiquinone oxidoreductase chain 2; AltName: Full=NADH dehydrogenase subunit 2 [Rhipicephalus sanguineus]AAD05517.1 NADH dehydrogenase 2 [Rhipicephalus sanguineus]